MKLGKREAQKNSCHLDDLGNLVRSKSLIIIIVVISYVLITCKWKNNHSIQKTSQTQKINHASLTQTWCDQCLCYC